MHNKKCLIIGTLLVLIVTIGLLIAVFYVGAEAASIFKTDYEKNSRDELVKIIESVPSGSGKPAEIRLKKGDALIGIKGGVEAFKCYSCPSNIMSSKGLVYEFPRSEAQGCSTENCICLCKDLGQKTIVDLERYGLTCLKGAECKTVSFNLKERMSLEPDFKKYNVVKTGYPYWENGFFYVRAKDSDTPFNGMGIYPADINYGETIKVFIEKKGSIVAVCPTPECLDSR